MPGLYYEGRWQADPAVVLGGGPERVAEEPPEDWEPPTFLGFGASEGDA